MTVSREMDSFDELRYNSWGQAVVVLDEISDHDLEDELMEHLEDVFCGMCVDETELNDYLSFEWEEIYAAIGLEDEDEEEEDEDE